MTETQAAPSLDLLDAPGIATRLAGIPLPELMRRAEHSTVESFGAIVTYSRKVFIPLTRLCQDVCGYCTFATTPAHLPAAYLSRDDVLAIARAGAAAGCREALFTLGDQPEARWPQARAALEALGYPTTLAYLGAMADAVFIQTGLLPHLNPGLMAAADLQALRPVAASMGLMLETTAARLGAKGGPHAGCPDKIPARRLAAIEAAGAARIPFTTGLLIGIGETRAERIDALVAIRDSHRRHGHVQEVIVQNFRAKPGTRMARAPEPDLDEHLWTIAAARLILGPLMTIQAPPNLRPGELAALLRAGVNDWGGVSPVTADHVNPEAPWPHLDTLAAATAATGRLLRERLAVGPRYAQTPADWLAPRIAQAVRRATDARGLPIADAWRAGTGAPVPALPAPSARTVRTATLETLIARAEAGQRLTVPHIERLFEADGHDVAVVTQAADALRARTCGDTMTYVVNRNINYTNICLYKCGFCGFSKGSTREMRGPAYRLDLATVARRAAEAHTRGATEVCLQGGIHPDYDGNTYLAVVAAVREAAPGIHIHAFSPLEITHGAATLGMTLPAYLARLKEAGLSTLPGTAAEILDDGVRAIICPDKLGTAEWLQVMRDAHATGLRTTATIMFGHVDSYASWARHLLAIRDLQAETGGFTEFVPLPFVHMEAPIWGRGLARSGPSFRETMLMHAVARLVLHPLIGNIQASWVKLGPQGVLAALCAGANDLGGTLMDESITRAAGGQNGQCLEDAAIAQLAAAAGRRRHQRTTLYAPALNQAA